MPLHQCSPPTTDARRRKVCGLGEWQKRDKVFLLKHHRWHCECWLIHWGSLQLTDISRHWRLFLGHQLTNICWWIFVRTKHLLANHAELPRQKGCDNGLTFSKQYAVLRVRSGLFCLVIYLVFVLNSIVALFLSQQSSKWCTSVQVHVHEKGETEFGRQFICTHPNSIVTVT